MTRRRITDHVFRAPNGKVAGILPGRCCWLGTCNQPKSHHTAARQPRQAATTLRAAR